MKVMQKVVISLVAIIIVLIPVTGVSGNHGGGLVSIDSFEMENNIGTTNEDDIPLSVIVTNNDPEDAWAIKFRGLLKDPVTGEYYRQADGSAQIITVWMTNIGASTLYNLYPNETKLLELEIETSSIPYGVWSVDIGVEIFELDTYTDMITTPSFEVVEPIADDPVVIDSYSGVLRMFCCFIFVLLSGSIVLIRLRTAGLIFHAESNTDDSEVQPPPDAQPSESPFAFPPETDF